jgi:hypothetical protein
MIEPPHKEIGSRDADRSQRQGTADHPNYLATGMPIHSKVIELICLIQMCGVMTV